VGRCTVRLLHARVDYHSMTDHTPGDRLAIDSSNVVGASVDVDLPRLSIVSLKSDVYGGSSGHPYGLEAHVALTISS
jgi:hypothetical protein